MRNLALLLAVLCLSAPSAWATLIVYDGFDYTAPANLGGQTNPFTGTAWASGNLGTGSDSQVNSGSLTMPTGIPPSIGNSVLLEAKIGTVNQSAVDRIGTGRYDSSTLFYSLALDVTDIGGLATSGAFIAGFNNQVPGNTNVTNAGTRLQIRKSLLDGTKFNLGVRNDVVTSRGTAPIVWDATEFSTGTTIFVVGEYEFNSSTVLDDVARLWINPDPSTVGADTPPSTTLVSSQCDISQNQIQSFFVRENSVSAQSIIVDEVRVGTSWADVAPEPAALALMALGAVGPLARRRRR